MSDPSTTSKAEARSRAADVLCEYGFSNHGGGDFRGELVRGDQRYAVRLNLPDKFPLVLPAVFVQEHKTISRRAHIEQNGKLCLFPTTGVLIDTDRPEQVVFDSLARAHSILFDNEDDYREEFLAYWRQAHLTTLLSVASDLDRVHALAAATTSSDIIVVADSHGSLHEWLRRVGWQAVEDHNAFLVPLRELPDAPPFGSISSHRDVHRILQHHSSEADRAVFSSWLDNSGLPAFLIFSAPAPNSSGRIVFAVELQRAKGQDAIRLHKGFRPGKLPPPLEVARSCHQPAVRIEPKRADANYLLSRVGGDMSLRNSSVIIIGCGALGSQIATNMAASGIGTITLVDHDELSADNIHRHALGMSHVGKNKASALRDHLLARLPHLAVLAVPDDFEAAQSKRPELLRGQDLAILATGDETLECCLNAQFDPALRRVHGWLEPLGIGGHVLLTGSTACYNCLFDRDEDGLHNLASLVQRGQNFLRTITGCTATFTPFGFVDAVQGAVEVTRVALDVLKNRDAEPRLVSWAGVGDGFLSAGYALSNRGERALALGRLVDHRYNRPDCEVCRGS